MLIKYLNLNFFALKGIFCVFSIVVTIVVISSCSEPSKNEIIGSYGKSGEWFFRFDSTLDLKKYWLDQKPPESIIFIRDNYGPWDGTVYCEKSDGEEGVGYWKFEGNTNWGSSKINITWQKSGFYNLSFYRNGGWYFKKSISDIYFTAGEKDYELNVATWKKNK